MDGINLIPAHRVNRFQRRTRVRLWATITICYGGALLAVCMVVGAMFERSGRNLAGELAAVETKVHNASQAIALLGPQIAEARITLDASRAVRKQPDWSIMMVLLARNRGDMIILRRCKLEPFYENQVSRLAGAAPSTQRGRRRYKLFVSGLGKSQGEVSQFVLRLENIGLFDRVSVIKTKRETFDAQPAIAFELECTLGGSKGAAP